MSDREPREGYHPIYGQSPLAVIVMAVILVGAIVFSVMLVLQAAGTAEFSSTLLVVVIVVLAAAGLFLMTLSQRIHYLRNRRNGNPLIRRRNGEQFGPLP